MCVQQGLMAFSAEAIDLSNCTDQSRVDHAP